MSRTASNTKDMTTGSPMRLLLMFSMPLMLGNLFQQLYTFVDALIVGQCVGADALAALGATEWLTFIMFGVTSGITQGCSVVVAGYFGKKQTDLLKKAIFTGYFIAAAGAICLTVVGQIMIYPALVMSCIMFFAGKEIVGLFIRNTEIGIEEMIQVGYSYLCVLALGFPLLYCLYVLRCCVQGMGDSVFPMLSSIVQVIMRVSCALFLIRMIGNAGVFWGEVLAWFGADIFLLFETRMRKLIRGA